MAIYKCKMCGGDLELAPESTVIECEYCGTKQTVPTADDERKMTLFQRANRLRFGNEFDKAAGVYENIIGDFPEEAEAYWGLVLCKYGIEYVDDPATAKKIPTCHRSSFDSVMDDSNFEMVMEYADIVARTVYREEAKQIEEIRKGIIEVSGREEPYDIFICYKETAENGDRTIDSVLAQDIYDRLIEKGYRVFFSRVTLEDKLGVEYEPYIFAALNSAKIMLAFGTSYDYYNAVWVKNEWSRYLQLMTKDKSRYLIPCYKDIDAYDMPKEFSKLQAQDLGKVGAIQDLLRGIEKILPRKKAEPVRPTYAQEVPIGGNPSTEPLLKRIVIFMNDEDWQKADQYCEKVLDLDPENPKAYFFKYLTHNTMTEEAFFAKYYDTCDGNTIQLSHIPDKEGYCEKVMTYITQEFLQWYYEQCNIAQYSIADKLFSQPDVPDDIRKAEQHFKMLNGFSDSAEKARQCGKKYVDFAYQYGCKILDSATNSGQLDRAIGYFNEVKGSLNCSDKLKQCDDKRTGFAYEEACRLMSSTKSLKSLETAKANFASIINYSDSAEQIKKCEQYLKDIYPVELFKAAYNDEGAERIDYFIQMGADVNYRHRYDENSDEVVPVMPVRYYCPLDCAIRNLDVDTVKLLVDNGADVNSTVLIYAGNITLVVPSLSYVLTAYNNSARTGDDRRKAIEIIKCLLTHGALPNEPSFNLANEYDKIYALGDVISVLNDVETVKLMIDYGADVNAVTVSGSGSVNVPMLFNAIDVGSIEIFRLLAERGADLNALYKEPGCEFTALIYAAGQAGNADIVRYLLERGVNPNGFGIISERGIIFPLHAAIMNNSGMDVIKLLIDYRANLNEMSKIYDGNDILNDTPFTLAVRSNNVRAVRCLLDLGADAASIRTFYSCEYNEDFRRCVLADAVINNNIEIARMLLERGADVNYIVSTKEKNALNAVFVVQKPLLTCAIIDAQSREMVDLLLSYGASWDVEVQVGGMSRPQIKFPYRRYGAPDNVLNYIKTRGWKDPWF